MTMMNKIKGMLKGRESQAAKGIDMVGDMVDRKTHGKYRRHVDKAQGKLKDEFARPEGQGPSQGGGQGPERGRGPQTGERGPYGDQRGYGDQGRSPH